MAIVKNNALVGAVGNICFRQSNGQNIVQIKPRDVKQTIKTKESGISWGLASASAKQIRVAYASMIDGLYDGKAVNRLNVAVSASEISNFSETGIYHLPELSGFEFNIKSSVADVLNAYPKISVAGEALIRVEIPSWQSQKLLQTKLKWSACCIRLAAYMFEFQNCRYTLLSEQEVEVAYSQGETVPVSWDVKVPQTEAAIVTVAIALDLYQENNRGRFILNDKSFSPASIVESYKVKGIISTESPSKWITMAGYAFTVDKLRYKAMKLAK